MSFDSLTYLGFLPAVAVLHRFCPHRLRWVLLLFASAVFYASWNVPLTLLLYSVIGITYAAGLLLNRPGNAGKRKVVLAAALIVCIGLLLYFKYFRFLMGGLSSLVRLFGGRGNWQLWDVLLPVGISFYTFQAMSYVVDVYRGMPCERHFGYYALYISFFPQLVAGPIERAASLLPQLKAERTVSGSDRREALSNLLSGFFKKIVLADFCGIFADRVYASAAPDGSAVFLGTLLFAVQIYCDFSGYSEIARGSALLVGIRLMKNFDRPYLSPDIRAFWRRWHISLSGWLTDYVYIPLGGSRCGLSRQITATLTVFLLSGLWHGADWTFVLWGLMHGILVILCMLLNRKGWNAERTKAGSALSGAVTFGLVTLLWVLFRSQSPAQAFVLYGNLFSAWDVHSGLSLLSMGWQDAARLILSLAALLLLPRLTGNSSGKIGMQQVFLILVIALAWWIRLDTQSASAFIYFQF